MIISCIIILSFYQPSTGHNWAHVVPQLKILFFGSFIAFSAAEFGKRRSFFGNFLAFLTSKENKFNPSSILMLIKDLDYIE